MTDFSVNYTEGGEYLSKALKIPGRELPFSPESAPGSILFSQVNQIKMDKTKDPLDIFPTEICCFFCSDTLHTRTEKFAQISHCPKRTEQYQVSIRYCRIPRASIPVWYKYQILCNMKCKFLTPKKYIFVSVWLPRTLFLPMSHHATSGCVYLSPCARPCSCLRYWANFHSVFFFFLT